MPEVHVPRLEEDEAEPPLPVPGPPGHRPRRSGFQAEIETNRSVVAAVQDYHATLLKNMNAYFSADANARKTIEVKLEGLRPALFEHTAWDLALCDAVPRGRTRIRRVNAAAATPTPSSEQRPSTTATWCSSSRDF